MSTATLTDKDLRVRDAVIQQLDWDPAVDAGGDRRVRSRRRRHADRIDQHLCRQARRRACRQARGRCARRRQRHRSEARRPAAPTPTSPPTPPRCCACTTKCLRPVQAAVHHGHVTLTGTVDWHYQRLQAEKAVRHIRGVRHVVDRIARRAAGGRQATCAGGSHKRSIATRRSTRSISRSRSPAVSSISREPRQPGCSGRPRNAPPTTRPVSRWSTTRSSSNRPTATSARSAERGAPRAQTRPWCVSHAAAATRRPNVGELRESSQSV